MLLQSFSKKVTRELKSCEQFIFLFVSRFPRSNDVNNQPINHSEYQPFINLELSTFLLLILFIIKKTLYISFTVLKTKFVLMTAVSLMCGYPSSSLFRASSSRPELLGTPDLLGHFKGICRETRLTCGVPVANHRYALPFIDTQVFFSPKCSPLFFQFSTISSAHPSLLLSVPFC